MERNDDPFALRAAVIRADQRLCDADAPRLHNFLNSNNLLFLALNKKTIECFREGERFSMKHLRTSHWT